MGARAPRTRRSAPHGWNKRFGRRAWNCRRQLSFGRWRTGQQLWSVSRQHQVALCDAGCWRQRIVVCVNIMIYEYCTRINEWALRILLWSILANKARWCWMRLYTRIMWFQFDSSIRSGAYFKGGGGGGSVLFDRSGPPAVSEPSPTYVSVPGSNWIGYGAGGASGTYLGYQDKGTAGGNGAPGFVYVEWDWRSKMFSSGCCSRITQWPVRPNLFFFGVHFSSFFTYSSFLILSLAHTLFIYFVVSDLRNALFSFIIHYSSIPFNIIH